MPEASSLATVPVSQSSPARSIFAYTTPLKRSTAASRTCLKSKPNYSSVGRPMSGSDMS